ncbi:MAG: phenylalanine--tRNA ligase subunit beta, partial [Gammaproteobacteria bacterium]
LISLVGGVAGPVTEVCHAQALPQRASIPLRAARLRRLLGIDLPTEEVEDILRRLGATPTRAAEGWSVQPPSYRFDMAIEADLIEDIGRIHGYNRLPSTRPRAALAAVSASETQVDAATLRAILIQRGYQEAITYSFVDPKLQQLVDPEHAPVALANPISSEMSVMRTTLWPGLIKAAQYNLNRQQTRIRFFEYGLSYITQDNVLKQEKYISGLVCGSRHPEQWGHGQAAADFFDVKADVEALLAAGGCGDVYRFEPGQHPCLHPGQTARILRDGQPVGWLGTLHPEHVDTLELPDNTLLFEISAAALARGAAAEFAAISRFPAIRRDLAFILPQTVAADAICGAVRAAAGGLLQDLTLFDVYQGQGIESGRKSIALGLILQDSSRTLTEHDVEAVLVQVQAALNAKFGAILRE